VLCESCGSIDVVRTRSSNFDKVVRFFTNRKRFSCRRCGWSARRDWHVPAAKEIRPTPTLVKSDVTPGTDEEEEFDIDKFH
jgi:hypothetical protein